MARLRQMDLNDPVIRQSAEQVVRWITIFRVNGELAVSRSIGDPDYKGSGVHSYSWGYPAGRCWRILADPAATTTPERSQPP